MSNLPSWARKPNHKKEVVATPRGWMVKETGEYLKLVRDLPERLKALETESAEVALSVLETVEEGPESTHREQPKIAKGEAEKADDAQEKVDEVIEPESVQEEKKEKEDKPKRRGRPRKSDTKN